MGDIKICVISSGREGKNYLKTGTLNVPVAQQRNKFKELSRVG